MRLLFPTAALLLALQPVAASAESRVYTVTSFDRIRITGPFTVNVRTGVSPSARANGSPRALDRVRVEVQGRTLSIGSVRDAGGGWNGGDPGPVTIEVTTHDLASAAVAGAGELKVDRVRATRFDLSLTGSGAVSVGALTADRLWLTVTGSGKAALGGRTSQVRALVQGAGAVDGSRLFADDVDLTVAGSADVALSASRSAKINASGTGDVTVSGNAACSVKAVGSGEVRCGRGS